MTSFDEVVQEYLRRLEEGALSFGAVGTVYISRRVWDIIATPRLNLVKFDPWDNTRLAETKDGANLIVRQDFADDHIEVICKKQVDAFEAVCLLVLSTLRETGENPGSIEMGTETWVLYQGGRPPLKKGAYYNGEAPLFFNGTPFHNGIPIKIVEGDPTLLRVKTNDQPPAWCQIGVCIGKKTDREQWATILGIQPGSILLDEVGAERNVKIPVEELRLDWEWVPSRPRIRDRFSRILDEG